MNPTERFQGLLSLAASEGATDIHLVSDESAAFRLRKEIIPVSTLGVWTSTDLEVVVKHILSQAGVHATAGDVDVSFVDKDNSRYRVNVHRGRGKLGLSIRRLGLVSHTPETLGLPKSFVGLVNISHGLVLIIGPTGNGKTTTRSALINHINQTSKRHIIVLEDTLEYHYKSDQSFITQRLIGANKDVTTYAEAITAAMRQNPDVISIGDLRDRASMEAALTAAETGHLVIAEMHASTTFGALNRIIGSFPADSAVKEQLAQQFLGAIAQRLLPRKDGTGLVLAFEVLLSTSAVKTKIRTGVIETIRDEIQTGRGKGMVLLEDSLDRLAREGLIKPTELRS